MRWVVAFLTGSEIPIVLRCRFDTVTIESITKHALLAQKKMRRKMKIIVAMELFKLGR